MSCSSVASLVTHFHNQTSNYQILVCSLLCTRGPACRHKGKDAIDFLTLCVLYAFVSWPFLFCMTNEPWPLRRNYYYFHFLILTRLLIEQTLTGIHHHLAWRQLRKCHELSGKCLYGLCGDRSELALPPLRAFTWMSVECEENVFYHTAAPPSIALTSSSDENVTAAGTYSRERASKWAYAARDSQPSLLIPVDVSLSHGRPSACHRSLIVLTLISFMPTKFCTPFFFKAHFGATAAWFFNNFQLVSSCCLQHLTFKDNMFSFCYSANMTTALRKNSPLWRCGEITLGCDAQIYRVTFTITFYELFNENDAFRNNGSIWLAGP